MDLDAAQTEWTLGLLPYEQLPELAAQMMVQGFEGPAILDLVGFHKPTRWELPGSLVDRAFLEAGRTPLPLEEAILRMAVRVCSEVVRDDLPPVEGVRKIEKLCDDHLANTYPGSLARMVAAKWEWEDWVEDPCRRRSLEDEILQEAKGFLAGRSLPPSL